MKFAATMYHISANSFYGNYSFLNLEIVENSNSCRKFQFFYLINWFFAVETIQGKKINCGNTITLILRNIYLDNWSSGQTNSKTSLVGNDFIFSDRSAGIDSSSTHPRKGNRSLVLTRMRYIHWSFPSFSGSMLRGWNKKKS